MKQNKRVCRYIKTEKAQEQDWDGIYLSNNIKLNTTST